MATKRELCLALYAKMAEASEDGSVNRKAFIERAVSECGCTSAGASTYYSNCKTEHGGGKVKSYYQKADTVKENNSVDDSKENAPLWSVVMVKDDVVFSSHAFMSSKGAAEKWNSLKPTTQARCIVVEGNPKEGVAVNGLVKLDPTKV